MNTEKGILFSKTKNQNEKIKLAYRLAENVISLKQTDILVYSMIISEIRDNMILSEKIFLNVSEDKPLAIRIFNELSENLVLPCCADEILDEIFERIL